MVPMRKFSHATKSEDSDSLHPAFTSAPRECRVSEPIPHPHPNPLPEGEGLMDKDTSIGEFPKCTEDDRAWRKEFSPGRSSLVPGFNVKVQHMKKRLQLVFYSLSISWVDY